MSAKSAEQFARVFEYAALDTETASENQHDAANQSSPNSVSVDEIRSKVSYALSGLPARERQIVESFLSGKPLSQIARELDLSLAIVEKSYGRALGLLRKDAPLHLVLGRG